MSKSVWPPWEYCCTGEEKNDLSGLHASTTAIIQAPGPGPLLHICTFSPCFPSSALTVTQHGVDIWILLFLSFARLTAQFLHIKQTSLHMSRHVNKKETLSHCDFTLCSVCKASIFAFWPSPHCYFEATSDHIWTAVLSSKVQQANSLQKELVRAQDLFGVRWRCQPLCYCATCIMTYK